MTSRILIILALAFATPAFASRSQERRVASQISSMDTRAVQTEKMVRSLDALFRVACWNLEKTDPATAFEICSNWLETFRPMALGLATTEGIGDHEPLSAWLGIVTQVLQEKLGPVMFVALHLDDIEAFNFGWPVLVEPHADSVWCAETTGVTCREEYREHASAFFNATSFWLSYVGCSVGTMGTGVFFVCGMAAQGIEFVISKTVSPRTADRIWDRNNP
jgi:hypothetical protein